MITLFGGLLGFFGSLMPEILRLFRDSVDRKHELELLKMQIEQQKLGLSNRLEEIRLISDVIEGQALYKTYNSGIKWVDALNGTVRPVISYAFFALYALVKISQVENPEISLWGEEDQAIFAGVISFYFGQRAIRKHNGL